MIRIIFLTLMFSLFTGTLFGQLDDPKKHAEGNSVEGKSIKQDIPDLKSDLRIEADLLQAPPPKRLLGQPDSPSLEISKKEEKIDMQKPEEFVNRTINYQPGYLQSEGEVSNPEFSKPQDLGRYWTEGEYVTVSWKDAQVVDGDRVDIIVNGEVVISNVTLLASYRSMRVDLGNGITKIEFLALNQGESGPNTADFRIEDANGQVLVHNQWNLNTGTKAHLLVIKK